jgi:hypothetical protein
MAEPSPAPIIFVERPRHVIQFGGLGLAAGAQATSVSSMIDFPYKILKVKVFFLDNAVPDLRYYILVGSSSDGSTSNVPSGTNIFGPYSGLIFIRGSQGTRIIEPMYDVKDATSFLKVHAWNLDPVYACDWAAEITIERLI